MRKINDYLKTWGSIRTNRSGMVRSAMARALAPYDEHDATKYNLMIKLLEQSDDDLRCVYCDEKASEWDHLEPVLKNKKPTGYGHTFGNLVPSCGACNKAKGAKDWKVILRKKAGETAVERHRVVANLVKAFPQRISDLPYKWEQLEAVCDQVLALFSQADEIVKSPGRLGKDS